MPASPRCLASEDVTIICDDDATAAQSDPIRRASRRADGVSAEGYSLTLNRTFKADKAIAASIEEAIAVDGVALDLHDFVEGQAPNQF